MFAERSCATRNYYSFTLHLLQYDSFSDVIVACTQEIKHTCQSSFARRKVMAASQYILPIQMQQPQFHSDSSDEEHAHDEGSYESTGSKPLSPIACDFENYEVLQVLQSLKEDRRNNKGNPTYNGTNSMHNNRRTPTATWGIGRHVARGRDPVSMLWTGVEYNGPMGCFSSPTPQST